MAARVSFTSDDSGSYYYDMYFHQQSLFAAVLDQITPQLLGAGHRRRRGHHATAKTTASIGSIRDSSTTAPISPAAWWVGLRTSWLRHGDRPDRIHGAQPSTIIDEPPGTGAHSLHIKAQIIQTFKATDNFTIVNNTFYDYMNRYNQTEDYYADTAKGSYTIENKTDFKVKFATAPVNNDIDAGFTYRYAHVLDIQNFVNEPVSIFDLSQSPSTWVFPASLQAPGGVSSTTRLQSSAVGAAGTFQGPRARIFYRQDF
jgi:hypothetical protein